MKKTLDLLLVRPGDKRNIYGDLISLAAIEPPLWAGLIGAYVRDHGFSVQILDMEAENLGVSEAADLISGQDASLVVFVVTGSNLSASTWKMDGAGRLARRVKEIAPHLPLMFWGLHPSALPERTLTEEVCDFVCRGEGFQTITALLDLLKRRDTNGHDRIRGLCYKAGGQVLVSGHPPVLGDLGRLPMAAWDLMPMDKYRAHNWQCFHDLESRAPYAVIYTSLGCPYSCRFCALRTLFGTPGIRYRSPEQVVREIDFLVKTHHIKNFKILDECFVICHEHTGRICDHLLAGGYDLNIWAYARIDTVDAGILKKMRAAGVRWLCYGMESGSDRILSAISKGAYGREKIREVVCMTRDAGIFILANFMFGFYEDNMASMRETLDFARELNREYTNFYTVMAYPGSRLFEDALKSGVRLPDTWLGYSQFSEEALPLPTRDLTSSQVLRFRDEAFVELHSDRNYLEMLEKRFGRAVSEHVRDLAARPLKRRFI